MRPKVGPRPEQSLAGTPESTTCTLEAQEAPAERMRVCSADMARADVLVAGAAGLRYQRASSSGLVTERTSPGAGMPFGASTGGRSGCPALHASAPLSSPPHGRAHHFGPRSAPKFPPRSRCIAEQAPAVGGAGFPPSLDARLATGGSPSLSASPPPQVPGVVWTRQPFF
jgi:hypothetical protein